MKVFIMGFLGIVLSASVTFAADCAQRFSWLPNAEAGIAGYKIHYGLTNGGSYSNEVVIDTPSLVNGRIMGEVPGLTCNKKYYFVCTAYNNTGLESDFSAQVATIVTTPTPTIINISLK